MGLDSDSLLSITNSGKCLFSVMFILLLRSFVLESCVVSNTKYDCSSACEDMLAKFYFFFFFVKMKNSVLFECICINAAVKSTKEELVYSCYCIQDICSPFGNRSSLVGNQSQTTSF